MKKKFMLFLMAVMVSVSAVCFASYGTDLDAETKIVDQFFTGKDYNKVVSLLDPALAKDLTAERYNNMFAEMNKDLGKMTSKDLRIYRVFEDGHILSYAANFEKGKTMALDVVFKAEKNKFSIVDFRIFDPNAQAPADNGAEKK